jgi:hypothetical protein
MSKKDPCTPAILKRKQGRRMTIKEWQLTVYSASPSSLWHDFFPKFIKENGVSVRAALTPRVWQALWDLASAAHQEMLDKLVAEGRPTIKMAGRNILYVL